MREEVCAKEEKRPLSPHGKLESGSWIKRVRWGRWWQGHGERGGALGGGAGWRWRTVVRGGGGRWRGRWIGEAQLQRHKGKRVHQPTSEVIHSPRDPMYDFGRQRSGNRRQNKTPSLRHDKCFKSKRPFIKAGQEKKGRHRRSEVQG